MTKNKCEKFKLSEDGFCENYIGNKEHKSACRNKCKVFNVNIRSGTRKALDAQMIGIEVPYETLGDKCIEQRRIKWKN